MNKEDGYKLTAKDAITVLQNLKDWLYLSSMNGGTAIQREAIDMAIRALEQPGDGCKTDENGYCFMAERRTDEA